MTLRAFTTNRSRRAAFLALVSATAAAAPLLPKWATAIVLAAIAGVIAKLALRATVQAGTAIQGSVAHAKAVDQIASELSLVRTEVKAQAADAAEATLRLDARINGLSASVSDEFQAARSEMAGIGTEAAQQLDHLSSMVGDLAERHTALRRRVVEAPSYATRKMAADLGQSVMRLHRLDALSSAYRHSDRRFPDRLVLLLAVERSGSTALFDLLRSHPDVYVEPLSFLWEELGLEGRRYPTSLSNQGRYTMGFETTPGTGALIPILESDDSIRASGLRIAVEKAHPHFYGHETERLLAGIGRLEQRGVDVRLVLQTRRPLEVMWSMAEYKNRDPDWYPKLDLADIPRHILTSMESLEHLAQSVSGVPAIDNSDLETVSPRLLSMLKDLTPLDVEDLGSSIRRTLTNMSAMQSGTVFVGERADRRPADGPDGVWGDLAHIVESATAIWKRLVSDGA